ncbi:D-alanyl-D-alanine carboxypeptidase family protein [Pelomonas sp. KK5]|uniref:D-alanyl-D-alanine carboxypeptidase family protein n=1 Tax=Pelomonas sp. KK5 TaxID=1855730 RepID=UPI001301A972|nr:serine hydrolase [Pelomonas sp. KK5]
MSFPIRFAVALCASSFLLLQPAQARQHGHVARPAQHQQQQQQPTLSPEEAVKELQRLRVNARHALVIEEGSGKIVLSKDADTVVPIASLTKLMTAMVVLDAKLDPQAALTIDRDDVDTLKHSASRLRVGAEMSRLDALKLALMNSENRAAAALARTFPGGMPAFELAMQAKIRSLGLTHTALADPTGLSPQNTSTASEMARIVQAAAKYPDIERITSLKSTQLPVSGRMREVHNTNRLVGGKGWDILLSKTGYTEEAGRCLTMRMRAADRNYTVVLLDADGSAQRLRDAAKIRQTLARLI